MCLYLCFFVVGVMFGAIMVNALTTEQKQDLTRYLGSFFQTMDGGMDYDRISSFHQSFSLHIKWILMVWILGMSIIGMPLILFLNFLKGVLIGFTVGYLVGHWSWKGMLFALVSVAPQNLVLVPALIIASVSALSFSILMIRNRFVLRRTNLYQTFIQYTSVSLVMGILTVGISLFEAYLSPVMMKWLRLCC